MCQPLLHPTAVASTFPNILLCATQYLNPGDRVIIIDDFLAGGTTADALIRLCRMAGAIVVGGGFLIEKLNDAGRAFLSGYQVVSHSALDLHGPLHSQPVCPLPAIHV